MIKYNWKTELKRAIIKNGFDMGTFTLKDIYDLSLDDFQLKFPNNNTIRYSFQGNMQKLRDDGFLKFIDYNGTYEVISKEQDEWNEFVKKYHSK